jgi:hypothetical protein
MADQQTVNDVKVGSAIISTAGSLGSMAVSTIATISDQKQRAAFSNNLALLSNDEQANLEKQLSAASSNDQRLKIITDALSNLEAKRIDLLTQGDVAKETQTRNNTYIAAGVFVVVALGLIVLIYKKD